MFRISRETVTRLVASTMAIASIGGAGCAGDLDSSGPSKSTDVAANPTSAESSKAVASLALGNGNTLEFYEFDTGVLISEFGRAGVTPAYRLESSVDTRQPRAIWRSLSPTTPVPQSLVDLEERVALRVANRGLKVPSSTDVAGAIEIAPVVVPGETPIFAAPDGCNNGCCDYAWLSTFPQCGGGQWFHYNAGSSWANTGSNAVSYNGFVCAATGTSTYKVTISGSGGTWSIAQGFYRTYAWSAGSTCNPFCHTNDKSVQSSVNTSSDPHLHTYCGYFIH